MASSVEEALYAHVFSHASFTTTGATGWWQEAGQGTAMPYAVLSVVSNPRPPATQVDVSAGEARAAFGCYSDDRYEAQTVAEGVLAAMRAIGHAVQGVTIDEVVILDCKPVPVPEPDTFRYVAEALVRYVEP